MAKLRLSTVLLLLVVIAFSGEVSAAKKLRSRPNPPKITARLADPIVESKPVETDANEKILEANPTETLVEVKIAETNVETKPDQEKLAEKELKENPDETKSEVKPVESKPDQSKFPETKAVETKIDNKPDQAKLAEVKVEPKLAETQLDEAKFEPKLAEACTPEKCKLPDCRCSDWEFHTPDYEGPIKDIRQFVMLTFDDAVNALNSVYYDDIFKDLKNPDNCPARGTFFISHEYTDYSKVNALYNAAHEIALHSITHKEGMDYWRFASLDLLEREFGQQKQIFEKFAKVNPKDIKGMRMPFLQLSGNETFYTTKNLGLIYDTSMPQRFDDPPMWPYTLDYLSTQDCMIGPCPDASIPGVWEVPMISWADKNGFACSMVDACVFAPAENATTLYDWIMENFNRHYESNRAPFPVFMHSAWFLRGDHYFQALRKFLKHVNTLPNVYITPISDVIEWIKNPTDKPSKGCAKKPQTKCKPVSCNLSKGADETRYMTVCDRCPKVYPWLDNPLGLKSKK